MTVFCKFCEIFKFLLESSSPSFEHVLCFPLHKSTLNFANMFCFKADFSRSWIRGFVYFPHHCICCHVGILKYWKARMLEDIRVLLSSLFSFFFSFLNFFNILTNNKLKHVTSTEYHS
jgi:hypothetical protein